jgi:hypothetical protein
MTVLFSPSDLYAANLLHGDYYMKSKAKFSSFREEKDDTHSVLPNSLFILKKVTDMKKKTIA